jgi:hypothetical protein
LLALQSVIKNKHLVQHEREKFSKTYQLIHVPTTDGHITLVLVHAPAEVADISLAGRVLPRLLGGIASPQTVVHSLVLSGSSLLSLGGGSVGARAPAQSVGDTGSGDVTGSDTTMREKRKTTLATGF